MSNNLIQNLEHYRNCFCNKDGGDRIVELLEFPQEKTGEVNIFRQEILFVTRGSVNVVMDGTSVSRRLQKGEFVFLPAGSRLACDVARDTTMLIVRVTSEVPECPIFRMSMTPQQLTSFRDPAGMHALKINKRIRAFIAELLETINDGFLCRHFLQNEANRLMFLLNAYYSEEDRVKFFSHILTADIKFSEFIRLNHTKYRSISEFSDVLCMTPQAFSNRFKKVFGTTPHQWLLQQKARHIYHDICRSDMPLKEIALKYDFPLSSNFFRFCKQTFGESPGRIRKNIRRNITAS